jgi:hypothetical protein
MMEGRSAENLNGAACNNRRRLGHFRVGKEFCKQRVTFGTKVPVVLVKEMATGNRCP